MCIVFVLHWLAFTQSWYFSVVLFIICRPFSFLFSYFTWGCFFLGNFRPRFRRSRCAKKSIQVARSLWVSPFIIQDLGKNLLCSFLPFYCSSALLRNRAASLVFCPTVTKAPSKGSTWAPPILNAMEIFPSFLRFIGTATTWSCCCFYGTSASTTFRLITRRTIEYFTGFALILVKKIIGKRQYPVRINRRLIILSWKIRCRTSHLVRVAAAREGGIKLYSCCRCHFRH